MKVYSVDASDGEAGLTFATKGKAYKHAREMAREVCPPGEFVTVEELTLVPLTKDTIVRLINSEGAYVAESRTLVKLPSKRTEPK
jgi:hypothetical protein